MNKDLATGQASPRLSPTNFYPLLAKAATPEQARTMIDRHLRNPEEFSGRVCDSLHCPQRSRIQGSRIIGAAHVGPMNYLVYLGLESPGYDDGRTRREFAEKSYALFLKEWKEHGHVHENYNAVTGSGDDVTSSDRFYHWGPLPGVCGVFGAEREERGGRNSEVKSDTASWPRPPIRSENAGWAKRRGEGRPRPKGRAADGHIQEP